jgi:hypothetical protein
MRLSVVAVVSLFASWGGGALVAQADPFLAPTITSISPDHGPLSGGTLVTVTGTNFTADSTVTFGATNAPTVTVIDSTTLTVVSPPSSGSVHVIVTTLNGMISSDDTFNYYATPAVTSVTPATGPGAGGTSVSISGSGFLTADTVTFGATSVPFTYVNDGLITAVSPAGAGVVDVQVSGPGGSSAISAGDQFTYSAGAPMISMVSPSTGPVAGGTSVVLTGSDFSGATGVTFGTLSASGFTVISSTQISAITPAGAAGPVDVIVTGPGGNSAPTTFTYLSLPTVTGVAPNSGPATGGTAVTISGTDLTGATDVTFGGVSATNVTVDSPTQITATSPFGVGTVDVRVTTPGGTSATSAADQFTYLSAPIVTGVTPNSGPEAGGTLVLITGANFLDVTDVKFGTDNATGFLVLDSSTVGAITPPGTGTVGVTVTTAGGTSAASVTFSYDRPPTVTGLSPASGPTAGGTIVTIGGTGFTGATAVTFGTTPAAAFTVDSATQITATAPSGLALTADVTVTGPNGTSATAAGDRFTWVAPTLGLSSTSVTAGDSVTISGSGFVPNSTSTVVLHSSPVTLATVTMSATGTFSATVTIPTGTAAGAHTLTVADASVALTVDPSALARTGSDPAAPFGLAAGLLALGMLLVGARLWRRRSAS